MPLSREDGGGTGQPCLCPAPGMEAAGAEERRVCGCCSGLSWPRCCKAPGEEGESGERGRGGANALLAGLPALGVTLPAGRRKRKRPPRAPGLTVGGGGARSELGRPQRAPGTCAGPGGSYLLPGGGTPRPLPAGSASLFSFPSAFRGPGPWACAPGSAWAPGAAPGPSARGAPAALSHPRGRADARSVLHIGLRELR